MPKYDVSASQGWRSLVTRLRNHISPHVLLVTAHPDDEAFFFGPTLIALLDDTQRKLHASSPVMHSLCLSVGGAEGLGATRAEELARSLDVFGVNEDNRLIIDHNELKDNIKTKWDPSLVADTVEHYVISHNITTILTFDPSGVSSHPNHQSLYHGTSKLLSRSSIPPGLRAYALVSVPLSIKYIAIFAPLQAKYDLFVAKHLNNFQVPIPVFVAGASQWLTIVRAIISHRSQLAWFRWLNMAFSRYLWVNEWVAIETSE
ncbi:putative deacetylase LmbE-like domain-containing protein [Vararia minispora EC-137]|uniref:Deacetylase LmbE-like domain-containing protein n=1 Tax=Vararia minispora EC-137 TaxID=1314806 RepID=A0ACB8QM34_9AGAM|nr:putative deacetylase LmbE-like domain-containing protein [Vararia minispora EC-137]